MVFKQINIARFAFLCVSWTCVIPWRLNAGAKVLCTEPSNSGCNGLNNIPCSVLVLSTNIPWDTHSINASSQSVGNAIGRSTECEFALSWHQHISPLHYSTWKEMERERERERERENEMAGNVEAFLFLSIQCRLWTNKRTSCNNRTCNNNT